MKSDDPIDRRAFLAVTALASASAIMVPQYTATAAEAARQFQVIGFTKPFQNVGFEETADIVAELGWSGIECPVRAKGQVIPERVEDDLPKLHEILQKRGLEISTIITDIRGVNPLTERVLRAAAKLGIKRYRLTFVHYDLGKPIAPQLANWKSELRDLVALNKDLGLTAGIQNHSGRDYVGAPVWDIYELVHDIAPEHLGICFDIGHATIEGATAWPINAKLMEPFFNCVYVKDFAWEKTNSGWRAKWGPLGEGMIRPEFFRWLKLSSFTGPVSLHCEYLSGVGKESVAALKKDTEQLKKWLA